MRRDCNLKKFVLTIVSSRVRIVALAPLFEIMLTDRLQSQNNNNNDNSLPLLTKAEVPSRGPIKRQASHDLPETAKVAPADVSAGITDNFGVAATYYILSMAFSAS